MISIILYVVLAAALIFLSIKLSDLVDLLDKKTNLSGALLGGILLAAVTSLPELFTSLTGTLLVKQNSMVLGNIMGSDFFDIIIFGVVYFLFFKRFTEGKVGKQHYFTILFTGLMIVALSIASFVFTANGWLLFGIFNPMSIVIIIIYVISVILTPATEEKEEKEEPNSKLTIKQIWILFAIFSVLLIGCSIAITYVADAVGDFLKLDKTFVGSLFLGIATSIPEVTATIALCSKKNFDAAYGDIFGSCVFNVIILAIADIFSFVPGQSIYQINTESFMLIIGTGLALLLSLLSILYIRSKKMKNNAISRIILYTISVLLIGSYVVYLVLSNIPSFEFAFLN